MKLDEAIQKARKKLQNPAAKAAVQGEIHYLGVLTEAEMNQRANSGNAPNGDRASEGKAVVAFRLYVSAVRDRTKATPEEAFEAAKVIVFEAFQGPRENKAGFANCLREILDRKVEAIPASLPAPSVNQGESGDSSPANAHRGLHAF